MEENKVYYHTIEHINDMLLLCNKVIKEPEFEKLNSIKIDLSNTLLNKVLEIPERLFFSILFHDVIYDVKNNYNELDSANFFKSYIETNNIKLSKENIFIISEIIYSTRNHKELFSMNKSVVLESSLLIDLDLYSLSDSFDKFKKNNNNILKEYEVLYEKSLVRQGRKEFLEKLLNKDKIYLTNYFLKREKKVKDNIKKILLEI